MNPKRKHNIIAIVAVIITICCWIGWANTALEINEYKIIHDQIPESFSGFRIAQVSDLHNAELGNGNENLLAMLSQSNPDMIVLTGDLIDSRQTDIEIALDFADEAVLIAPVYYVTGNHEARVPEYEELKMRLTDIGVTVLENQKVQIIKDGESITLMGIQDQHKDQTVPADGIAELCSRQTHSVMK